MENLQNYITLLVIRGAKDVISAKFSISLSFNLVPLSDSMK